MRIIVVGAGPAGAIAALELARAGAEVVLAEKHAWPREKTCGDAISPLGIAEGRACGLKIEGRVRLPKAFVSVPSGCAFRGAWPSWAPWGTTIKRKEFDASLVSAAVRAGASFHPSTMVKRLEYRDEGIKATLRSGATTRDVVADAAILAEGATGSIAQTLGFPPPRARLLALRGYVRSDELLDREYALFFEPPLSPGYGWIFPMDEENANVGILVDESTLARAGNDLRGLFESWIGRSPYALRRIGRVPAVDVRGGVIPSGRRRHVIRRVFLVGDAAGVADPFTAEGIFQAMRCGRLAARSLAESRDPELAGSRYERDVRVFDRNARVARAMRATFNLAIEPYARRAAQSKPFASHMTSEVFFLKRSFAGFVWGLTARLFRTDSS